MEINFKYPSSKSNDYEKEKIHYFYGSLEPKVTQKKQINNCLTHSYVKHLTHYQMTNFRLFQTERVCRRQFQI